MPHQLIQLISNFHEIIKRSRFIDCITDIREMQERINDAIRDTLTKCKETHGPRISIVIPTRNESHYLPRLLHSIKNQCYQSIEVLIADYASTDNTREVATRYKAKIIDVDKPGIGYATYLAVNESRGEIIIRTDADAIFPRTIISSVANIMLRRNKLVAHLGHIYYDGGFVENAMAFYYDKYLRNPWNTTGHFIAFKRDLVEKGINFNPKLRVHEDYDFGYTVYKTFGPHAIYYDYYTSVMVSARRIRTTGLVRYVLGFRKR